MKNLSLMSILSMFAKNCHNFVVYFVIFDTTVHLSENPSNVVLLFCELAYTLSWDLSMGFYKPFNPAKNFG